MGEHQVKWMESMKRKLNTDEAGVREFMRQNANKSNRNNKGTGGFAYLKRTDPERLKQISQQGVKSRAKDI